MRRGLLALAAVVCGGLALVDIAAHGEGQTHAASTLAGTTTVPNGSLVSEGHDLFLSSCAACHGMNAQGIPGRAPSLHGVGALAADFYLETGRMPLPSPRAQPMPTRPAFSQAKIQTLIDYVASFGGPAIPTVHPQRGSLSKGQSLFALDCAGCHTIQGSGGIVTGAVVPSLNVATPRQIAEAIRIGPYVMPRFGPGELSEADIDSIARYVHSTQSPDDRGGWGIGRIGPIPEGMVAWLLAAAALLLIARLIGERTPAPKRSSSTQPGDRT
ncbi:MAG TPA: c-type cytochrome [Solirubrobacteraceae bacterium]|jgi:ubiquinol-cytochrome c reductase cytochrome c subunit|nr:c-type cytochrome [Solirubrobacteraceae bacterium]